MNIKTSVIIVSWNTRHLLADCLYSVVENPPPKTYEIWVVDNGSTDGTQAMLAADFPQVRLIQNRENVGFARANNQAIEQSAGEYILLLNPDTVVHPGALAALVKFLHHTPSAGAVGPLILNPDGTLQMSAYPAPTLFREGWRLLHLDALKPVGEYRQSAWGRTEPRPVDNLLGACILLRRAALAQVGIFDEQYFIYSEEIDLCFRLRRAGWQLFWLPTASIVHLGGQSTHQVAETMFLHLYRGKILYFKKHYGALAGFFYKFILLLMAVGRLAMTPLIFITDRQHRSRRWQLVQRYWQLVKSLPAM